MGTQSFSKRNGPRDHLVFPSEGFLQVADRLQETQPGLHPHFLSLWPDTLCRDGLRAIVDDLQAVSEEVRLQEVSYQLVAHLHPASKHGIRSFEHEDLSVSILSGPELPGRARTRTQEPEKEGQWVPEGEPGIMTEQPGPLLKKQKSMQGDEGDVLVDMEESKAATLVRSIDRLTRIMGMPWHTGFVVAGCMLTLRHEMAQMDALHVESTLEMAADEKGRVNALSMMACIRK